jgi:hypothetical protein
LASGAATNSSDTAEESGATAFVAGPASSSHGLVRRRPATGASGCERCPIVSAELSGPTGTAVANPS